MFRPQTSVATSLNRSSSRSSRCPRYVDPLDLRKVEQKLGRDDIREVLEQQIEQRGKIIEFLEEQLRNWSDGPDASSTWS